MGLDMTGTAIQGDQLLAEHFPVGEMIADELEAREWSQADFADIIGRPEQFVSEIISGKRLLTRDSARQIGAAFGTSADMWLRMQDTYLMWLDEQDPTVRRQTQEIRQRAELNSLVPVGVLKKRGFVSNSPVEQQLAEVLDIFGVDTLEECKSELFAARRSNSAEEISPAQRAWVACVRKVATALDVAEYNQEGLKNLAQSLHKELWLEAGMATFQARFAEVGVKLVYVEAFPGAKIDGCSLIQGGNPVIGLSGRGKRLDKVFFTLLHEIAHTLLGHHHSGAVIVDDLSGSTTEKLDAAADALAEQLLFPAELAELPARVTRTWVAKEAKRLCVPDIVVVGYLQKRGLIPQSSVLGRRAASAVPGMEEWASPRPL